MFQDANIPQQSSQLSGDEWRAWNIFQVQLFPFFYGFSLSNLAWVHMSLFSRFIDSLNLLRGFFIFVTFVCKSSVIRKIRRALWPNQHLTVAWDVEIFKCHQKVNWVALQIVLVRCDNKLLFYEDQKWTLTDIWSFSNKKKFQWGNFLDMLFLGWINTVIILAPFFWPLTTWSPYWFNLNPKGLL